MRSVARTLNETYDATPESVAKARAALSAFAAAAGADREQVESVRLAVSEAMTNAVVHAYRGGPGEITVTCSIVSDELWIVICDDGCGLEPRADRPGLGLGLGLISQLSDDFAIVSRATGGTEVRIRFTLDRTPTTGPDSTDERPSFHDAVEGRRRHGFSAAISVS